MTQPENRGLLGPSPRQVPCHCPHSSLACHPQFPWDKEDGTDKEKKGGQGLPPPHRLQQAGPRMRKGPAVPTWPSAWAPMFTRMGTKGLAEPKPGTHRASSSNLAWHKTTLTLQGQLGTSHTPTPCQTNHTALRHSDMTQSPPPGPSWAPHIPGTKGRGASPTELTWPAPSACKPGGSPARESLPLSPWHPHLQHGQLAMGPLRPGHSTKKPCQRSTEVSSAQSSVRTPTSCLQAREQKPWSLTLCHGLPCPTLHTQSSPYLLSVPPCPE